VDLDVNLSTSQAIHLSRALKSCKIVSYPLQKTSQIYFNMSRKKSLLIGINYTGSENELRGCHQDVENVAEFLSYRGYSDDPRSQVILRDDMGGQYYPSGHNILVPKNISRLPDFLLI
jgi:Caspase domain